MSLNKRDLDNYITGHFGEDQFRYDEEEEAVWVYKQTEPRLFTVGFYDPEGTWYPEKDFATADEAAARVNYLNGGQGSDWERGGA
jgi:hypothetical protein